MRATARGDDPGPTWRSTEVAGRSYRAVAVALPGGGAIQFAEDITELEAALRRLQFLLVPTAILTGAAVGVFAWYRAGSASCDR